MCAPREQGAGARLSHVDAAGAARMVDVSDKAVTAREAVAAGRVRVSAEVLTLLRGDGVPKGDALGVARLAGIMAAKRAGDLIPLCHPLGLESVEVAFTPVDAGTLRIEATAKVRGRTGVEMEALTAVSVAALTVYDMAKAVDRGMVIDGIKLEEKSGGRSGTYRRASGGDGA